MKIAVPVDENTQNTNVCVSFGRAPYFLFFDTKTKQTYFVHNSAASSTGGAGIQAAQIIVDNGVDVLLTPRCGEQAADVLIAADIALYKTFSGSAQDNLDAFAADKFSELDDIHAGFHGHGGK